MSDKKSKSKSKEKSEKSQKDKKSKKSKEQKPEKSKKSVDKGSKKEKGSKKSELNKSKISKPQSQSQDDFSLFKPMMLNPPPAQVDESICVYHSQKITHFCETSQQVCCESCLVYGPFNNQMHRVGKIDEIFKARYLYLNEVVCGDLLKKRDRLMKKIEDLITLSDQLRYVKNGIEKMTKIELNISGGNKFAILNHQMATLQKDLENINSLGNQFFQLTNMNPENNTIPETNPNKGMVPFLLRSKYLQEEAEDLISKPIKTTVDIYPYDLPRQITEKKLVLDKNKGGLDLLRAKDEVIWQLLEEKKVVTQDLWKTFYEEAKTEAEEWEKLNYKLRSELEAFNMRCSKCGCILEEDNINQPCSEEGFHYFLA